MFKNISSTEGTRINVKKGCGAFGPSGSKKCSNGSEWGAQSFAQSKPKTIKVNFIIYLQI